MLYRSARPVPPNAKKRRPVYTTGRTGHRGCICQVAHCTSFLSRQCDVIASFSFGAWSVRMCFLQRDVLKFNCEFIHFILLLRIFTEVLIIMSSPGQKRGTCGHVMASFDGHLKCARCRDKVVGEDNCVLKKDCPICKAFTPEQVQQLVTPTYRERKNKDKKMVSSSPTPTLGGTQSRSKWRLQRQ